MLTRLLQWSAAILVFATTLCVEGQSPATSTAEPTGTTGTTTAPVATPARITAPPAASTTPATPSDTAIPTTTIATTAPDIQSLLNFRSADIKFDLRRFMELLQDRTHEGWVLAAYPAPKTGLPLIGALKPLRSRESRSARRSLLYRERDLRW